MVALVLLVSAAAQTPPPIVIAPTVSARSDTSALANIVEYRPSSVKCGDQAVTPRFTTEPLPTSVALPDGKSAPSFTVTFRVSADGRPTTISNPVRVEGPTAYLYPEDLAPTLAAWRFDAGERDGCSVTFAPNSVPVATAPLDMVYRFVALPRPSWPGWDEARRRAAVSEGGNCTTPRPPAAIQIGVPDFERIPQAPATMSWTMVGYDIDSAGKPMRIRTLASDGNNALDRAAVQAVGRSRYPAGTARTGCTWPFHRRQNVPVAAPPMPPADAYPAGSACAVSGEFTNPPSFQFPAAFRRRAIEGWAIVQYDVAPWGATGNIKVLRAEPAAQFGDFAKGVISQAKVAASATGASGCIKRVRFVMPLEGSDPASAPSPVVD